MRAYLVAIGFCVLCLAAGASLATVLAVPAWWGGLLGAAIGSTPLWLPLLAPTLRWRCMTAIGYALLLALAAVLSLRGIWPALAGGAVQLEPALPALLVAPALYVVVLALRQRDAAGAGLSVADRLGAALGGPPLVLSLALAVVVATCVVLGIRYVGLAAPAWESIAAKFVERGVIPPLTLMLFFWGLLLLASKAWALRGERHWLRLPAEANRSQLLQARAQALVSGELGAADDWLDMLWKRSADFYIVPRYINWAIPILGFIGTVLGISLAADGIGAIIGARGGFADLASELGEAIAPLGIAFDTTLIALSLSVLLMLLQAALQRFEDDVLVACESRVRTASTTPVA